MSLIFSFSAPGAQAACEIIEPALQPDNKVLKMPVQRHALIIGNSKYLPPIDPVPEAEFDVDIIAEALKAIGFSDQRITTKKDVLKEDFYDIVDDFACAVRPGDIAMVYYSGHGIELNRENFFVNVNAEPPRKRYPQAQLQSLSEVVLTLRERNPSIIAIFLDACRSNPFPQIYGGGKSTPRGLAKDDLTDIEGVTIIYAAAPGKVSFQYGANVPVGGQAIPRGSVFTRHMGRALRDTVESLSGKVDEAALGVFEESDEAQRPHQEENVFGKVHIDRRSIPHGAIDKKWANMFNLSDSLQTQATKLFYFINRYPASDYEYFIRSFLAKESQKSSLGMGADSRDESYRFPNAALAIQPMNKSLSMVNSGGSVDYKSLVAVAAQWTTSNPSLATNVMDVSHIPSSNMWWDRGHISQTTGWERNELLAHEERAIDEFVRSKKWNQIDLSIDWNNRRTTGEVIDASFAKLEKTLKIIETAGIPRNRIHVYLNSTPEGRGPQNLTLSGFGLRPTIKQENTPVLVQETRSREPLSITSIPALEIQSAIGLSNRTNYIARKGKT